MLAEVRFSLSQTFPASFLVLLTKFVTAIGLGALYKGNKLSWRRRCWHWPILKFAPPTQSRTAAASGPHAAHGVSLTASSKVCKQNDHRPGFRPYGG